MTSRGRIVVGAVVLALVAGGTRRPMDFARSVADQLVRTGRASHPTIGVLAVTVTAEMAAATGLPRGTPSRSATYETGRGAPRPSWWAGSSVDESRVSW
jgi:S1-C subfamily serine protease